MQVLNIPFAAGEENGFEFFTPPPKKNKNVPKHSLNTVAVIKNTMALSLAATNYTRVFNQPPNGAAAFPSRWLKHRCHSCRQGWQCNQTINGVTWLLCPALFERPALKKEKFKTRLCKSERNGGEQIWLSSLVENFKALRWPIRRGPPVVSVAIKITLVLFSFSFCFSKACACLSVCYFFKIINSQSWHQA